MAPFTRRGFGRIYVLDPDNIQAVKDEIMAMDEEEFNNYLPNDLIAPFSEYPRLVYTHKFDAICLNRLAARLWSRGVYVFCLDNGRADFFMTDDESE